jgi:hypothetical protein
MRGSMAKEGKVKEVEQLISMEERKDFSRLRE